MNDNQKAQQYDFLLAEANRLQNKIAQINLNSTGVEVKSDIVLIERELLSIRNEMEVLLGTI